MKRDSVIFYRSFYEAIKELPKQNQAEIYEAIFNFQFNFQEPELKGLSKTVFQLIKPQLEANNKKYTKGVENGSKGAEHGIKGGRPPKKNNPQNNPQITDKKPSNVNVNVNENENVNVNEQKHFYEIDDYLNEMCEGSNAGKKLIELLAEHLKISSEKIHEHFNEFKINYIGKRMSLDEFSDVKRHFGNYAKKFKKEEPREETPEEAYARKKRWSEGLVQPLY